jgi:hypothetical protein
MRDILIKLMNILNRYLNEYMRDILIKLMNLKY